MTLATKVFTPEQEARVREIAIEVAVAASKAHAQLAANHQLDQHRLSSEWVREFLDASVQNPSKIDGRARA